MEIQNQPINRDSRLWMKAKERASFKYHLASYIIINIFLWILCFITGDIGGSDLPWAVWPTAGWGIGLFFHWISAYKFPQEDIIEREYEKLRQKENKF